MSLNSTATERSDDLTLDRGGNVRMNGIPRRRLQLQVMSLAQFETRGKSQIARLEEIMRKRPKGEKIREKIERERGVKGKTKNGLFIFWIDRLDGM